MYKEIGLKQLRKIPDHSLVFIDMIGYHWIPNHRGMFAGELIRKNGIIYIKTKKFIIRVVWKSDVPNLEFKLYVDETFRSTTHNFFRMVFDVVEQRKRYKIKCHMVHE